MRKTTGWFLIAALAAALVLPAAAAERKDEFQIIKKAVRENPDGPRSGEARFLKVAVIDGRTNRAELKLTLPLVLVELIARCSGPTRIDTGCGRCDLDLADLLADLRKAGPAALVEIIGRDGSLKIWLE